MIPLGTTLAALGVAVVMLAIAEAFIARGADSVPVRTLDPLLDHDD